MVNIYIFIKHIHVYGIVVNNRLNQCVGSEVLVVMMVLNLDLC